MYQKFWLAGLVIFSLMAHGSLVQAASQGLRQPAKPIQPAKQQMSEHTDDLRALMLALYHQNPDELAKSTQVGPREMTEWVFDGKANWKFDSLRQQQKTQAIVLAFDPDFNGDHILALVVGVETMLFDAYGGTNEFDIPVVQNLHQHMQASCDLQALLEKINSHATATKPVAILEKAISREHIHRTLRMIIERIQGSDHSQFSCPVN